MKIILRETYDNLGRTGDIVEVKAGFARNFLVPQGIAYPNNRLYKRMFENEREQLLHKDAIAFAQAEETAGKASGAEVSFTVKIGDRGKMFGAITNTDIAKELAEKGIEVDRRKIVLKEPIKTTGQHLVPVKLHGEVGFTIAVNIIPETQPEDELDDEERLALEEKEKAAAEAMTASGEQQDAKASVGDADAQQAEIIELVEAVPAADDEASDESTSAE